jgi:hypothetical protein
LEWRTQIGLERLFKYHVKAAFGTTDKQGLRDEFHKLDSTPLPAALGLNKCDNYAK